MKFNKGRIILYIILGSSLSLITFSSLVNLYENKDRISRLITRKVNQKRFTKYKYNHEVHLIKNLNNFPFKLLKN